MGGAARAIDFDVQPMGYVPRAASSGVLSPARHR